MSQNLYLWKLTSNNETVVLFAVGTTPVEATERVALYIAAVNSDPAEVSRIEANLRSVVPTQMDFSEGVGSIAVSVG